MRARALGSLAAAVGALALVSTPAPGQVVVAPAGPITTVAEGLRLVPEGGTVVVRAGVYREPTIVVDRPVTLEGHGNPVLDGEGRRQILVIRANGVTVRGITFQNVGTSYIEDRSAIRVEDARDCVIEDNHVLAGFFGIYLARSGGCRIERNVLEGAGDREAASANGIHLWYARGITVRGNRIRGHRDGIYFEFVEDADVHDNVSEGNFRYGLHFMFSDSCRYTGNAFRANGAGVAVMYTNYVTMTGNRFEENWGSAAYGLLLKDITDSEVERNVFRGNTVGVFAEGSNRVQVRGNDFADNGWAVRVMANATDNVFTDNNFERNTFDVATNSRRAYSTFRGNYWDTYTGYDLDGNGIGDVPHRPVRLFSLLVEQHPPALVLLRSLAVQLLDQAERVVPTLTPETLVDDAPRVRRIGR
jgi:nitrous oxidase accessory protein